MTGETSWDPIPTGGHVVRPARTTFVFVWLAIAGVFLVLGSLWFFFLTGDIAVLVLPFVLGMGLLVTAWVAYDAQRQGLPVVPWAVVAFFLSVLGLAIYLVVREFRPRPPAV